MNPGSFLKDERSESLESAEHLELNVRAACLFAHTHPKILNIAKLCFRAVAIGVTTVGRKEAGKMGSGLVDHEIVEGADLN